MEQFSASLNAATSTSEAALNCFENFSSGANSNVQSLSAMLAAIKAAGSPSAAIPSQQSAFALLRKSAGAEFGSDLGFPSSSTPSTSSIPAFMLAAQNNSESQQQQNLSGGNNGGIFLPPNSKNSPPLATASNFLNSFSGNDYLTTNSLLNQQQNTTTPAAAVAEPSNTAAAAAVAKIFANAGSNLEVLAKIQQYMDTPRTALSNAANSSSSNLSFLPLNSFQKHSILQQQQQTSALPVQNFEQHQRQFQTSIKAALEPHMNAVSTPSSGNSGGMSIAISQFNTISANASNGASKEESTPVRRIRRRRPKSPRPMKSAIGNLKTANYSFSEQQTNTPDDPVINSPPTFIRVPTENSMGLEEIDSKNDYPPHSSTVNFDSDMDFKRNHKACLVCGDHATGYNFNVITCESCKAFFRRNALRPKDFKCPYTDECQINTISRRFCQKCRLRKCFMVGMKKEWILNDDQLKRRKNSRLKNNSNYISPTPSSASHCTTSTPTPMSQCSSSVGGFSALSSPGHENAHYAKNEMDGRERGSSNRTSAFFASTRHSTDLPVINPPSVQSSSSIASGISLSPDSPTSNNLNNALPQIEPGDDHYNPNIMHIRSSNCSQIFPVPSHVNTSATCNNEFSSANTSMSLASSSSSRCTIAPPLPSSSASSAAATRLDINTLAISDTGTNLPHPAFPSSVEALLHRGQPKIALSFEDYQRLIQWNTNQTLRPNATHQPHQLSCSIQQPTVSIAASTNSNCDNFEPMDTTSNLSLSAIGKPFGGLSPSFCQQLAAAGFPKFPSPVNSTQGQHQPLIQNYLEQHQQNMARLKSASSTLATNEPRESNSSSSSLALMSKEECAPPAANMLAGFGTQNPMASTSLAAGFAQSGAMQSFGAMGAGGMGGMAGASAAMIAAKKKHMEDTIHDELYNSFNKPLTMEVSKTNVLQDMLLDDNYRLNSYESNEIELVRKAFKHMDEKLGDNEKRATATVGKKEHNPVDILNIMDIPMRRFVKVSKELKTFMELSSDGRLQILKAAMINLLTIRGLLRMDRDQKNFASPVLGDHKVSTNFFERLNHNNQKNYFFICYEMMHESIRTDTTAMYLISLMILFDHYKDLIDERDQEIGRRNKEHYENLLKRYAESIHGDNAAKVLETVPIVIQQLYKVSHFAATAFVGRVKPEEAEPLPTEFFKTTVPEANDEANAPISVVDESEDDADAPPSVDMPAPTVVIESGAGESVDGKTKADAYEKNGDEKIVI